MTKNYYHTLGLSPSASAAEVKAAYKRMALQFHPDRNPGNARAEEQFKQVNEAYQVLSSPRRRAIYDQQRFQEQRQRQPAGYADPRYQATRPPAGYRERHYRQRPQKVARFSRKDIQIVVGTVLLVLLLVLAIKLAWDRFAYSQALEQAAQAETAQQWHLANERYSKVLAYNPDLQEARLSRAALRLNQLKDHPGALADYTALVENSPQPQADWYLGRGLCYLALKSPHLAIQDFNTALYVDPSLSAVYLSRGKAHLLAELQWEAALADLTHFIQDKAVAPAAKTEAYLYRAFAYYRTQQYTLAWQDTEEALTQDPINAQAYYLQAVIARAQKSFALSCALLEQAAKLGFAAAIEEMRYLCRKKE